MGWLRPIDRDRGLRRLDFRRPASAFAVARCQYVRCIVIRTSWIIVPGALIEVADDQPNGGLRGGALLAVSCTRSLEHRRHCRRLPFASSTADSSDDRNSARGLDIRLGS